VSEFVDGKRHHSNIFVTILKKVILFMLDYLPGQGSLQHMNLCKYFHPGRTIIPEFKCALKTRIQLLG